MRSVNVLCFIGACFIVGCGGSGSSSQCEGELGCPCNTDGSCNYSSMTCNTVAGTCMANSVNSNNSSVPNSVGSAGNSGAVSSTSNSNVIDYGTAGYGGGNTNNTSQPQGGQGGASSSGATSTILPACIPVDGVTACEDTSQCCQSGTGIGTEGAMCMTDTTGASGLCQASCQNNGELYCDGHYSGACATIDGMECIFYYNLIAPINCQLNDVQFGDTWTYQTYCPLSGVVSQAATAEGESSAVIYKY